MESAPKDRREPFVAALRSMVWWPLIAPVPKEWLVTDTVLDGTGVPIPGRHPLDGTDLEIAYTLLGDDLVLRVNKGGVQVFGVVLENAGKAMAAHELLELKAESSNLVVPVGTRGQAARDVGYRLGRVASKLLRATRESMGKS
jgi:hypothetical protein